MERLQLTHHPNEVDDGCGHEHHEHATQPDQSTHMASIGSWRRCLIFDIRHRSLGFHADQLSLLLLLLLQLRAERCLLVKPVARFELSAARRVDDKPQITYRLMLLLLYFCLFTLVGSKKIPVSRYAAAEMRELLADQAMELYLKSSCIPYNTQEEWGTFFVLLFCIKISYGLSKFSTLLLIKFDISRGISIVYAVLLVSYWN